MSAGDRECLFSPCNDQGALQTFKTVAVQKIVATSKAKPNELYKTLSDTEIFFAHKSCYSKSRNNERKKRKYALAHTVVSKRLLNSQCSDFVFKRDCLLCGNVCKMKDSNNPHRWVQVRQCKTVNRGSAITFKQQLEDLCDERGPVGNEVAAILSGVIGLHAADAQYHAPCYNLPSITGPLEEALRSVLSIMAENATDSWITSELYVMYVAALGTVSRRQFVSNVTAHFGDEFLVFHIEGCDSVVGFKASLGKVFKIDKKSQSMGDDDELEKLVRKIRSEVMAKPRNVDYKLRDYVHHKVIESTSAKLRSLVSSLVSGGAITKPSLTLAQCIQQHVDGTSSNQTTLGLSVKLLHKHGSWELVKTVNKRDHKFIRQSYEVPQVSGQVCVGQPVRLS